MENPNHCQDASVEPMLLSACGGGVEAETASHTSTGAENTSRKTSSRSVLTLDQAAERRREKARVKTEEKVLSLIAAQGRVEKTNHPEATNGSYFSPPSGRVLAASVVGRLIASGHLVSCNDGLFDDSQTYEPSA